MTHSQRTVIVGGPKCGKTTLCKTMPNPRHTDDLIETHDWSAASEEVSHWFDEPGPWTVEGVATARALRKWLRRNETGKPCDETICLWSDALAKQTFEPYVPLNDGQMTMAKGVKTVFDEIAPELLRRGVILSYR